jgi:hypothetical protein
MSQKEDIDDPPISTEIPPSSFGYVNDSHYIKVDDYTRVMVFHDRYGRDPECVEQGRLMVSSLGRLPA